MAIIKTPKGIEILIDDENFGFLSRFTWSLRKCMDRHYPVTARNFGGHYHATYMHRMIMNAPPHMVVDHVNGNPLDNRIENLRICLKGENGRNRKPNIGRRFKGVRPYRNRAKVNISIYKFEAHIFFKGKPIAIGRYVTEDEAARAYDEKAIELFGEFANLNFPKQKDIQFSKIVGEQQPEESETSAGIKGLLVSNNQE